MDEVVSTWVFGGLTAISGLAWFLFWNQIVDMKSSVKELIGALKGVSDLVQLHDKEIAVMKEQMKNITSGKK
jgi:hypothetical protein